VNLSDPLDRDRTGEIRQRGKRVPRVRSPVTFPARACRGLAPARLRMVLDDVEATTRIRTTRET
jgi:hypothetical protein